MNIENDMNGEFGYNGVFDLRRGRRGLNRVPRGKSTLYDLK